MKRYSRKLQKPVPQLPKKKNHISTLVKIIFGLIAFLGSLAAIYGLINPQIVGVHPQKNDGQVKTEPTNGIALWVDGSAKFENYSIKNGGFIKTIEIVALDRSTEDWLPPRTIRVDKSKFGSFESKSISFGAQFRIPQLSQKLKYPIFNIEIRFIDQNGAVINEKGKETPFVMRVRVSEDLLEHMKNISG